MFAGADRQLTQPLDDVRQPDESPCLRGDRQGFVGVALGLCQLPLGDGDARTRMQGNHFVPARHHSDSIVSPASGGGEFTTCQQRISHRIEAANEELALWHGALPTRLTRCSRGGTVATCQCSEGDDRVDGILGPTTHGCRGFERDVVALPRLGEAASKSMNVSQADIGETNPEALVRG